MPTRGKRLILIALLVALGLGGVLVALNRPAGPRAVANPLRGAWRDEFFSEGWIDVVDNLRLGTDGMHLSQIHDMGSPVADAFALESLVLVPDGRLFGLARCRDGTIHLFVYDPTQKQSTGSYTELIAKK